MHIRAYVRQKERESEREREDTNLKTKMIRLI